MRFRTLVMVGMLALVVGVLASAFVGVAVVLDRAARHDVDRDLDRARTVFEELFAYRASLFRAEARVVAEEPRLKAVVTAADATPETVVGVAVEMRRVVQSDLFYLTDADGVVRADVVDKTAAGRDRSGDALVATALAAGEASTLATAGGRIYEMHAQRVGFGATPAGVVVVGFALDDRVADAVERQSATALVLASDGSVIAASSFDGRVIDRADLARVVTSVPTDGGAVDLMINGEAFRARAAPLPGSGPLRAVLLRSLDEALAPRRRLTRVLFGVLVAAVVAALGLAIGLARRLSAPLDALVAFARDFGAGKLDARPEEAGPLEVRALARALGSMATEVVDSRAQLAQKERLEQELEIAARIQTAILPRALVVPGWDASARMMPATEVGGDYYDVIPAPAGTFVGIGDVAGHGLTAGIVMLMVQSATAALAPTAKSPRDVVIAINRLLYENIRRRLRQDEHVTFSLLHVGEDGRVVFAGAHEDLCVYRRATKAVELVPTPGSWLGAVDDVSRATVDTAIALEPGDVLVLHTDGITEARDADGEMWGIEGLSQALTDAPHDSAEAIRDAILAARMAFDPSLADDVTLLVLRYAGGA